MKRLLKLFSLFVIILFATLTISSCGKKKEVVVNQSEVKLISFGEPTKDNAKYGTSLTSLTDSEFKLIDMLILDKTIGDFADVLRRS